MWKIGDFDDDFMKIIYKAEGDRGGKVIESHHFW